MPFKIYFLFSQGLFPYIVYILYHIFFEKSIKIFPHEVKSLLVALCISQEPQRLPRVNVKISAVKALIREILYKDYLTLTAIHIFHKVDGTEQLFKFSFSIDATSASINDEVPIITLVLFVSIGQYSNKDALGMGNPVAAHLAATEFIFIAVATIGFIAVFGIIGFAIMPISTESTAPHIVATAASSPMRFYITIPVFVNYLAALSADGGTG